MAGGSAVTEIKLIWLWGLSDPLRKREVYKGYSQMNWNPLSPIQKLQKKKNSINIEKGKEMKQWQLTVLKKKNNQLFKLLLVTFTKFISNIFMYFHKKIS